MTTFNALVYDPQTKTTEAKPVKATPVGQSYFVHHPASESPYIDPERWDVSHACGESVGTAFTRRKDAAFYAAKLAEVYDAPEKPTDRGTLSAMYTIARQYCQ